MITYEDQDQFRAVVPVMSQNSIHEEARNSCYYSVQTLLSSRLLSKKLKIKIEIKEQ